MAEWECDMMTIDHRKKYILMVDTETANAFDDPLVYDLGLAVIDKKGNVYESRSYVNADIYLREAELMRSAYYAEKLPQYQYELDMGWRKMATTLSLKKIVAQLCRKYGIDTVCAHNSRFDYNALNTTLRYVTKSEYRYFFPKGMEIWDTKKMADCVLLQRPSYVNWCTERGYLTATGRPRVTAEVLYRYIKNDPDFIECHTGLEDVLIEKEILAYLLRQHKAMQKTFYKKV